MCSIRGCVTITACCPYRKLCKNLAPWHSIGLILLEMGAEGVNVAAKNPNVTYGVLGVGTVLALKSKVN